MGNDLIKFPEEEILNQVTKGTSEFQIVERIGITMTEFCSYLAKNPDFSARLDQARLLRSEKWVNNIVSLVQTETGTPIIHDKDDTPGAKLAIDTFKWLAKVDNPDKYGEKTKVEAVNTHIFEVRGLSHQEALDMLRSDPFAPAVPAEFKVVVPQETKEESDDDEDML